MAGSPTPTDCPIEEPRDATDVDEVEWEVSFTGQFAGTTPWVPSRSGTPVPAQYDRGRGSLPGRWPDQETTSTVIGVRSGTGGNRPRVCWPRR
jgi:hypothetical protein